MAAKTLAIARREGRAGAKWLFHFDVPGHDAYCIAAALAGADRDGSLEGWLKPKLAPGEAVAGVERGNSGHSPSAVLMA